MAKNKTWKEEIETTLREQGFNDIEIRKLINKIKQEFGLVGYNDEISVNMQNYKTLSKEYFRTVTQQDSDIEMTYYDVRGNTEQGTDYPCDKISGVASMVRTENGITLFLDTYTPNMSNISDFAGISYKEFLKIKVNPILESLMNKTIQSSNNQLKREDIEQIIEECLMEIYLLSDMAEGEFNGQVSIYSDPLDFAIQTLEKDIKYVDEDENISNINLKILQSNFIKNGRYNSEKGIFDLPEFDLEGMRYCILVDENGTYTICLYKGEEKYETFKEYMDSVKKDMIKEQTDKLYMALPDSIKLYMDTTFIEETFGILPEKYWFKVSEYISKNLGIDSGKIISNQGNIIINTDPNILVERLLNKDEDGLNVCALLRAENFHKVTRITEDGQFFDLMDFEMLSPASMLLIGETPTEEGVYDSKLLFWSPPEGLIDIMKNAGYESYMFSRYLKDRQIIPTEQNNVIADETIGELGEINSSIINMLEVNAQVEVESQKPSQGLILLNKRIEKEIEKMKKLIGALDKKAFDEKVFIAIDEILSEVQYKESDIIPKQVQKDIMTYILATSDYSSEEYASDVNTFDIQKEMIEILDKKNPKANKDIAMKYRLMYRQAIIGVSLKQEFIFPELKEDLEDDLIMQARARLEFEPANQEIKRENDLYRRALINILTDQQLKQVREEIKSDVELSADHRRVTLARMDRLTKVKEERE